MTSQGSLPVNQPVNRKSAGLVGGLFLIAMIASITGGLLVSSVTDTSNFMNLISENKVLLVTGVLLELINGIAVVLIGILMFQVLKLYDETSAAGYLGLRIVEAVFCCIIVIAPVSLLTVSTELINSGISGADDFVNLGLILLAERQAVAELLIPVFLGLGGIVFYSALYRTKLLPRYIAVWGFVGALLMLFINLLLTFQIEINGAVVFIFVIPLITNEIYMGVRLIFKGFNTLPVKRSAI
ncbi:MAG: DUF4386 domain-containing protein [Bacteroidetes bacterium]|nr:DUF4386 domain-containing protein [Bacteroidota bacterium]